MASMESKQKEKALKIKNEFICRKFDKTTYHNKNGGKITWAGVKLVEGISNISNLEISRNQQQ